MAIRLFIEEMARFTQPLHRSRRSHRVKRSVRMNRLARNHTPAAINAAVFT